MAERMAERIHGRRVSEPPAARAEPTSSGNGCG